MLKMWGNEREDHIVPERFTLRQMAGFGYSRLPSPLPLLSRTHLLPEDERRIRSNGTERRRDARGDDGHGEHYRDGYERYRVRRGDAVHLISKDPA